MGKENCL